MNTHADENRAIGTSQLASSDDRPPDPVRCRTANSEGGRQANDGTTVLRVGTPYITGRTRYPSGVIYNYVSGGHLLLVFIDHPTHQEVAGFRANGGPIHLGFLTLNETIMMAVHVAGARYDGDAPFSIHLVPPASRGSPPIYGPGVTRGLIQVVLVDATTGIVRGLRTGSMSNAFTIALHDAIRRQQHAAFSLSRHDANIRKLYEQYSTPDALMAAAISRTTLGD